MRDGRKRGRGTYTLANEVLRQIGGEHVGGEGRLHLLGEDLFTRTMGQQSFFSLEGGDRRTLRVVITPCKILRLLPIVSAASNMGSCDSWRSLL